MTRDRVYIFYFLTQHHNCLFYTIVYNKNSRRQWINILIHLKYVIVKYSLQFLNVTQFHVTYTVRYIIKQ